jgi:GT2 family glycosyltransferase
VIRIIVLNWNGQRWLERCLTALRQQESCAFEVVVVDNASTDGSVEFVRTHFPEFTVLALEQNRGFSGGNNAGARGATTPYLAFLNNDTEVAPGWIASLVRAAERDPGIGVVASQIVFMDHPTIVDSAGDGYLRCGAAFKHRHGQPRDAGGGDVEVFGACGAGFLIRRDLFERLGGFDEDYFMVHEDVDLSYRARLLGSRCVLAREAIVHHAGSASLGRVSAQAVFYGQRNLEWTWIKNSPPGLLLRSFASHVAYDLAGMIGYARVGHLGTWLRAKAAAVAGLPQVLRKRREIQRRKAVSPAALWQLMDGGWIAIKRREKAFALRRRE